jgi:hypothetical protein
MQRHMHTPTCTCTHTHTNTHTQTIQTHTHTCTCTHALSHICTHVRACVRARTHTHRLAHTCTHMPYTGVCARARTHAQIHIHTHKHTHKHTHSHGGLSRSPVQGALVRVCSNSSSESAAVTEPGGDRSGHPRRRSRRRRPSGPRPVIRASRAACCAGTGARRTGSECRLTRIRLRFPAGGPPARSSHGVSEAGLFRLRCGKRYRRRPRFRVARRRSGPFVLTRSGRARPGARVPAGPEMAAHTELQRL